MKAQRTWTKYWGVYLFLCVFLVGLLDDQLTRLNRPCSRPIEYRLGDIDSRFGLSQAEATDALARAANLWNSAAHKTLFSLSPGSNLPVHFIYSDQQRITKTHQAIGYSIEGMRQKLKQIREQLDNQKADYSARKQRLEAARTEFELSKSEYNLQVNNINSSGGASESDMSLLEMKKTNLIRQQQELQEQAIRLNEDVDQINSLTALYNAQVDREHREVDAINVDAGKEFLAGRYVRQNGSRRIEIYEFGTFSDLVAVLAHELGHALGLGHSDNPKSIMSPSSEQLGHDPWEAVGENLVSLSKDDLSALNARCRL